MSTIIITGFLQMVCLMKKYSTLPHNSQTDLTMQILLLDDSPFPRVSSYYLTPPIMDCVKNNSSRGTNSYAEGCISPFDKLPAKLCTENFDCLP